MIPCDPIDRFHAMLRGMARHLTAGDWPARLPETWAGRPTLADPQALVVLADLDNPLRRLWRTLPGISLAGAIWLALVALPLRA